MSKLVQLCFQCADLGDDDCKRCPLGNTIIGMKKPASTIPNHIKSEKDIKISADSIIALNKRIEFSISETDRRREVGLDAMRS